VIVVFHPHIVAGRTALEALHNQGLNEQETTERTDQPATVFCAERTWNATRI
jgi:hypothetical protein